MELVTGLLIGLFIISLVIIGLTLGYVASVLGTKVADDMYRKNRIRKILKEWK